jgi:hypothetical protein
MQWSRLKAQIEGRFADTVRRRVALHDTWYRTGGRDHDGRVWLTVDGQEAANFCDFRYWKDAAPLEAEARRRGIEFSYDAAHGVVNARGVFNRSDAYEALNESLSFSVDDMLRSESGIVRALAMLDRRLGKRRLARVILADDEIPLVRACFALRCEAEGITPDDAGPLLIGPPDHYSAENVARRVDNKRRLYQDIPGPASRREALLRSFEEETSNPHRSLSPAKPANGNGGGVRHD